MKVNDISGLYLEAKGGKPSFILLLLINSSVSSNTVSGANKACVHYPVLEYYSLIECLTCFHVIPQNK